MSRKDDPTPEQKAYWTEVAARGCIVPNCGSPATIAHAHGPSLREVHPDLLKPKGIKKRWMHWLVLPLCPLHHGIMDNESEAAFFRVARGTPRMLLHKLAFRLDIDVFAMAFAAMPKRSLPRRVFSSETRT